MHDPLWDAERNERRESCIKRPDGELSCCCFFCPLLPEVYRSMEHHKGVGEAMQAGQTSDHALSSGILRVMAMGGQTQSSDHTLSSGIHRVKATGGDRPP